tara:strand:- start:2873 stop:3991 length:1119 start_codon:yes stop_codon:yes gene_type:complete
MAYDKWGRWVPVEEFDWTADTEGKIQQLEQAGLDWESAGVGEGKNVFYTSLGMGAGDTEGAWVNMTEEQRLEVLEEYDNWYDAQSTKAKTALGLTDTWGMDLYRGVTYNQGDLWNAKEMFHDLVGIKEDGTLNKQIDYNDYNRSYMWRGIVDDIKKNEKFQFEGKSLFDYVRDPITNKTQIRAGNQQLRDWSVEKEDYWDHLQTQARQGSLPDNQTFRNQDERNIDARIARWKPYFTVETDPETGEKVGLEKDMRSGEVLNRYQYNPPSAPERIQITDDESLANPKEGIFYTGLVNYEREDRPAPQEPKPPRALNLNIKQYIPRDRSRDYMNIENHPYLGKPEPPNSAANKIEVVESILPIVQKLWKVDDGI